MEKQMEIVDVEAEVVEGKKEKPKAEVATKEKKAEVVERKEESTVLSNDPFESTESFNNYFKMASYLAKSDMVPQSYQGNPVNCLIALEQAKRMHASPLMVMQNLYIVKGKPSWSGQACSMIVNGCGLFENVDLVYVGERGKDSWGAYVKATRLSDGKEVRGTVITMDMAKKEGWTSNKKWLSMPEQMLGYRAYSFFARLFCPNALSGFKTEGEVEDIEASKNVVADNPF